MYLLRGSNQDHLYSQLKRSFYEAFQAVAGSIAVEGAQKSPEALPACPLPLGEGRGRVFPLGFVGWLCSHLIAEVPVTVRAKLEILWLVCFLLCIN